MLDASPAGWVFLYLRCNPDKFCWEQVNRNHTAEDASRIRHCVCKQSRHPRVNSLYIFINENNMLRANKGIPQCQDNLQVRFCTTRSYL